MKRNNTGGTKGLKLNPNQRLQNFKQNQDSTVTMLVSIAG